MTYNEVMHRASLTLLLFALTALPAAATTVYKSVDTNGVVSFSDQPPASGSDVEVLELNISSRQASALDSERLDAMRATTDRMAKDRREREKLRLLARQQQFKPQPQQIVTYYPQPNGYSGYSNRRSYGGHYRPKPEHPSVKPPHSQRPTTRPPAWQGVNDYPASLIRRKYSPRVRASFMNDPVPYRGAARH
jgi:hypothetical protein